MKHDSSSSGEPSILLASNEFLNQEVERLQAERDAMRRELQQIHASYAWRMVDGYRRWLTRHRENPAVRCYEKIAIKILDLTVGGSERDVEKRYQLWINAHALSPERSERIRAAADAFPYRPLVSVVLTVGGTISEPLVAAAIDSVRAQLYEHWQLVIASDEAAAPSIETALARGGNNDSRITMKRFFNRDDAAGAAPIDLRDLTQGEFITFLDQQGRLAPEAFYEVVKRLNRNPLDDLFYWDEDQLTAEACRTTPFFKPDWNPDLLLSMNYVGECFVIRKTLAEAVGGLQRGFAPGQNYDLVLRAAERSARIVHLAKLLYHRSNQAGEFPPHADAQREGEARGLRALEEALRRRGTDGSVDNLGAGLYAVRYEIREHPMVSIVIPTRDRCALLRQCLESVARHTDYDNYQIIIMDNDSVERETLAYLQKIRSTVQVHRCPGAFNFSALNNLGVTRTKGEFLVFLNNDTQVIRRDWMHAMLEQARRPEVGAVGAKLLFADERIQHAGIVLGLWGMVGHAFRFTPANVRHDFGLPDAIRDCSAVTGACIMMRRDVFNEVAGFDEQLPVAFNDVDLCLRLRARGYLVVYTPRALLYHYESATRRRTRVVSDEELFLKRWGETLKRGDPYYNRNLTLSGEDWTIAV
jgi:GT2 family glycosyltransferase